MPTYVKKSDIARARRVAEFLGKRWKAKVTHSGDATDSYDAIFALRAKPVVRIADIRARNVFLSQYKTLIAPALTVENLIELCSLHKRPGVQCVPVIVWLLRDAVVWVRASWYHKRSNTGRRDRGRDPRKSESLEYRVEQCKVAVLDDDAEDVLGALWGRSDADT